MSDSIWKSIDRMEKSRYGKMECMEVTDVVIVGGGLCGLLCAWFLKDAGVDCILIEKDRIAGGTGKDAMAQVTSQHGLIYSQLLERDGEEKARMYLKANELAIEKYRELSKHIDCDFEETSAFVYSKDDRAAIEKEVEVVNRLGLKAEFCETTELPFDVAGAIRFPGQAQLNPAKFMDGLVKDLEQCKNIHLFEDVLIDDWLKRMVWCRTRVTVAEQVICTTHFPFYKKLGKYDNKMHLEQASILALEHAGQMKGMYTDADREGLSFRSYGDLLLMAGERHKVKSRREGTDSGFKKLREEAAQYYPDAREVAHWNVADCISLDGIPYIGKYAAKAPLFYVATGFNGWGMTSAMAGAMLVTDMILKDRAGEEGTSYPWGEVFSPERKVLLPQYFSNIKDNISDKFASRRHKVKK